MAGKVFLGRELAILLAMSSLVGCGTDVLPMLEDRSIPQLVEESEHVVLVSVDHASACARHISGAFDVCRLEVTIRTVLRGTLLAGSATIQHVVLADRSKYPDRQPAFEKGDYLVFAQGARDALRLATDSRRSSIPIAGTSSAVISPIVAESIMSLLLDPTQVSQAGVARHNGMIALGLGPHIVGQRRTFEYMDKAISESLGTPGAVELCAEMSGYYLGHDRCLTEAIRSVRENSLMCGRCNETELARLRDDLAVWRREELSKIKMDRHEWFRRMVNGKGEDAARVSYFEITGQQWPYDPSTPIKRK